MEKQICELCDNELVDGKCVVCAINEHRDVVSNLGKMWKWAFWSCLVMGSLLLFAGIYGVVNDWNVVLSMGALVVSYINFRAAIKARKNRKKVAL